MTGGDLRRRRRPERRRGIRCRHRSDAVIRAPGRSDISLVSGTEDEWRNASIRAAPFANEANAAALAKSRDAVLTLQPVPLIVRRHLTSLHFPTPHFLPVFQWGRIPLVANLPLIIGSSITFITALIGIVRRGPAPLQGQPADM